MIIYKPIHKLYEANCLPLINDEKYSILGLEDQIKTCCDILRSLGYQTFEICEKEKIIPLETKKKRLDDQGSDFDFDSEIFGPADLKKIKAVILKKIDSKTSDLALVEITLVYSIEENLVNLVFNLSNDFFLQKRDRSERIAIENIDHLVMIFSYFNFKTKSFNFFIDKDYDEYNKDSQNDEAQAELKFKADILYLPKMNIVKSILHLIDVGMMIKKVFENDEEY